MYHYYQVEGGEEAWKPVQSEFLPKVVEDRHPMFVTVLATDKIASKEMPKEEKLSLKYLGPMYFDFDSQEIKDCIADLQSLCRTLERLEVKLEQVRFFATGSKGFHVELPLEMFMLKVPRAGVPNLPLIFKQVALSMAEDTMDWRVYSCGMGRMWRQPNVKRPNDRYKVPLTVEQVKSLTPDLVVQVTSSPVPLLAYPAPEPNMELAVLFDKAVQDTDERAKAAKRRKPVPAEVLRRPMPSMDLLMEGQGVRPGAGFNQLAMQLAIYAREAGVLEDDLVTRCQKLLQNHQGNGVRYNTPAKREEELRRMCRVIGDDPYYEFAAAPLRALLTHPAPDLDGITVDREQVEQDLAQAEKFDEPEENAPAPEGQELDEYADVAKGVQLSRYGVYGESDYGKQRICAVSFEDTRILRSMDNSKISCVETQVLVNGKKAGRTTVELDTFHSASNLNKFTSRYGHAFQGSEAQAKATYMRLVEGGRKQGREMYVHEREGLALVNIPHHPDERLRQPFLLWADGKEVVLEPRVRDSGVVISFQGSPDPRGVYKCDMTDAPALVPWLTEAPGNKDKLKSMLHNLFRCQKPDMVGTMLGWLTACFYKSLFQKAYNQFPILHINGFAGSGKCLQLGTEVLRADGTAVRVEDVQPGDELLGPDSQPRKVLGTTRGRGQLYKVTPAKGSPYVVNAEHVLSLKKSGNLTLLLADGTSVDGDADVVNVAVGTYLKSKQGIQRDLKGWRAPAVEFNRQQADLPLDPYWLGCWLGDGEATLPILHKPACAMTRWWVAHAEQAGCAVSVHAPESSAPGWSIVNRREGRWNAKQENPFTRNLRDLGLVGNKHIPEVYKYSPVAQRLQLLAGLLDSDGHLCGNGYDWISKDRKLAEDFTFICRSVGLACYMAETTKGIKETGFEGVYWRCSVSGDTDRIPCLDKKAAARQQVKRHLVTGITVEPVGMGEYAGFELDGDHLFLLGDFTVTHNSQMTQQMARLYYYNQEPTIVTPGSTVFALSQGASGSDSIPMIIDEYKPHDMRPGMHDQLRLMFRDAYNARSVQRGGGNRDNDNFKALTSTSLSAPIAFIAEAIEEETALMERVVLITMAPPPSVVAHKWATRFHAFRANAKLLALIGKYIASKLVLSGYTVEKLVSEFDPIYMHARNTLMLTEQDLSSGLSATELRDKQAARERSVYNFSVARFGLLQFKEVVDGVFGEKEFAEDFQDFLAHSYTRMKDLASSTMPEYLKVLNVLADLSYEDPLLAQAVRCGNEFGFGNVGGKDTLELSARACYSRYRQHCRLVGSKPLYNGEETFVHSLKSVPSLMHVGEGQHIQVAGGTHVFDLDELVRMGLRGFKAPRAGRR